jgi:hypothetical protein
VAPPLSACNPPRRVAGRATQASLNPLGFFGTRGWNSLIWLLIGSLTPFLVSGGVMCSHFCFGSLNEWKLNWILFLSKSYFVAVHRMIFFLYQSKWFFTFFFAFFFWAMICTGPLRFTPARNSWAICSRGLTVHTVVHLLTRNTTGSNVILGGCSQDTTFLAILQSTTEEEQEQSFTFLMIATIPSRRSAPLIIFCSGCLVPTKNFTPHPIECLKTCMEH